MQDGESWNKRRALIARNPIGYLDSALKRIKFHSSAELINKLYLLKSFGSQNAARCLEPAADLETLLTTIPFAVLLQTLSLDERNSIRLTLSVVGLDDLQCKPLADVIAEIEDKLEQMRIKTN